MKKIIAFVALFAILAGPSFAVAGTSVSTGLTQDTSGGASPIVKVKWEADGSYSSSSAWYHDDSTDAGAQFLPSGVKDDNTTIVLCAVVTDPDGLADVDAVYADVFYPENIALGTSHVALPGQSNSGCGGLMQEDELTKLSKAAGIELFCTKVQQLNNNLPTFGQNPTGGYYDYAEICAADGELQKETAAVYCGKKDISYEDPSGDYKVWAVGQDKNGLQGTLENHFTYLPVTAFEVDFNSVSYGNVKLNTHKIINGDLTWNSPIGANPASVRNVGNTRLNMTVMQNDMGLGQTSGQWNVKYDARVGSSASFVNYYPNVTVTLDNALDLSELDEMDFSIDISKFPPPGQNGTVYNGTMTLGAVEDAHLVCGG